MNMPCCALLFAGLIGLSSICNAKQLTPEQVTNLYLHTFINGNSASANTLYNAIKAEFPGYADTVSRATVEDLPQDIAAVLIDGQWGNFLDTISDADQKKLEPASHQFFAAVVTALMRSDCHATHSEKDDNASFAGQYVVAVQFSCTVPAIQPDMTKLVKLAAAETPDISALEKMLRQYSASLAKAPMNKTIHGQFKLMHMEQKTWLAHIKGEKLPPETPASLEKGIWYPTGDGHILPFIVLEVIDREIFSPL
ncbi:hypothetical protein DDM35_003242 [Escherichia coli]|nr:hypothetical protein [Escherichia coli]